MISGLVCLECPFQATQNHLPVQGHAELIIHDVTAVEIDDDEQVHEAVLHTNIRYIHRPGLIGMRDLESSQEVGAHVLGMEHLAQIGSRADAVDAHDPH